MTLTWEPQYVGGEKEGMCGGWWGIVDRQTSPNIYPGNDFMGLSVEDTLAAIDTWFPTPEPCNCERPEPTPLFAKTPCWIHARDCRWHLRYWLPWWPR
jgi:hypothetical protein